LLPNEARVINFQHLRHHGSRERLTIPVLKPLCF
jgi:hypothetical protein